MYCICLLTLFVPALLDPNTAQLQHKHKQHLQPFPPRAVGRTLTRKPGGVPGSTAQGDLGSATGTHRQVPGCQQDGVRSAVPEFPWSWNS
jgi:hypothetical protein